MRHPRMQRIAARRTVHPALMRGAARRFVMADYPHMRAYVSQVRNRSAILAKARAVRGVLPAGTYISHAEWDADHFQHACDIRRKVRHTVRFTLGALERSRGRHGGPTSRMERVYRRTRAFDPDNRYSIQYLWEPIR
ncbi:hypothetical protein AB0M10_15270 [Streptomyces sp. NPDC051840]|uniref:hypothetical protein n=1 Tax=Streptomyces sp. NPDC051840 TaxID=3154752 RepID=UPI003445E467